MSTAYQEERRQLEHVADLRAQATLLGGDCETAWTLAAKAADVERSTFNEFTCQQVSRL